VVGSRVPVIGREHEVALAEKFVLDAAAVPTALLLTGLAGIGKTAIWSEAVATAARRGVAVRSSRCTLADSAWPFSGLGDLLEGVPEDVLADLPEVQRRALAAAMLVESPAGGAGGDRIVGVALLTVLRVLARSAPLILAIDDVQWLDGASRSVLTFALHRIRDERIGVLAAQRVITDSWSAAEAKLLGLPVAHLNVGPISMGALQQILRSRLSMTFSRPTLTRIYQVTGGNPMVALEMGRALQRRGHEPAAHEPLPIPSDVQALVTDRMSGLSASARDMVLVCSAMAHPSLKSVAAALRDPGAIGAVVAEVVDAGVIEVDGHRLRFTHPLLASIPYEALVAEERRELHGRLANAVGEPEQHARHVALSAEGANSDTADALDAAARHARQRGSTIAAAELAELAISRTPPDQPLDLHRRQLSAAQYVFQLGDPATARAMVTSAVNGVAAGAGRVAALLLLAMIEYWTEGSPVATRWCEAALVEAGSDPILQARCHAALADLAPYEASRLLDHARRAVALIGADSNEPADVLANALKNVAYHELRLGQGLSVALLERAVELEALGEPLPVLERVAMYMGMLLRFSGRFTEARDWLLRMRACARDEGDDSALPIILGHLALLECWAGDFDLALHYAAEGRDLGALTGVGSPSVTAAHSLAEAHRGNLDTARQVAVTAIIHDESMGDAGDVACDLRALGFVELSAGNLAAAAEHLLRAVSIADELGVLEPSILRIHGDAVEALVGLGRLDEADALTAELERSLRPGSTWAAMMAGRCRGILAAAAGDLSAAAAAFTTSLDDDHGRAMPFERARTRLWLGSVLRRAGRRRESRAELSAALTVFEALDTPVFAERCRGELDRLGGRAPGHLELTPTETRVAELVSAGNTNQEVAAALFMGVRTVESHLSRIYRKLGLRSRTELARSPIGSSPGIGRTVQSDRPRRRPL
jgi:DNA-binding CsgD family transcriptional regulator